MGHRSSVVLDWLAGLNVFQFNEVIFQFDEVPISVEFKQNKNNCFDLKHLVCLKHLRHLTLNSNNITDSELMHLNRLTKLLFLSLSNNNITDVEAVSKP